mmetsp:Transcript_12803/g.19821  ORF Transcript_12803/g.19821 Transcript_12803/m.19821 type:complete len:368 (-) Transcript_12803:1996-3099(-)
MGPVVEGVSRCLFLDGLLVALEEAVVVLGGVVVLLLSGRKVKFELLLFGQVLALLVELSGGLTSPANLKLDFLLLPVVEQVDLVEVLPLSSDQLLQAGVVLQAEIDLLLEHSDLLERVHERVDLLVLGLLIGLVVQLLDVVLASLLGQVLHFHLVILAEVAENVRRFHSTSSPRAQEAFQHLPALQAERPAAVADPIELGDLLNSIALLVNWDHALAAEHNLVVVFIVAAAADFAAGVVLGDLCRLPLVKLFDAGLDLRSLLGLALTVLVVVGLELFHFVHLVHDFAILEVVPLLLMDLEGLQKVSLQLAGVVQVHQEGARVLVVPVLVLYQVLHEAGTHIRDEILAVLPDFFRLVHYLISELFIVG